MTELETALKTIATLELQLKMSNARVDTALKGREALSRDMWESGYLADSTGCLYDKFERDFKRVMGSPLLTERV